MVNKVIGPLSQFSKFPPTAGRISTIMRQTNLTKEQERQILQLSDKLGEKICNAIIYSTYNIFLTPNERRIAQQAADNSFYQDFIEGTKNILSAPKAFEICNGMLNSIKSIFKPFETCLDAKETKVYLNNASEITNYQIKLSECDEKLVEYQNRLCNLKKIYENTSDVGLKNTYAAEYNTVVGSYNQIVKEYNNILTTKLAPLVKAQLSLRETIEKNFSDVRLLTMIYGNPPRMPRCEHKSR